MKYNIDITLTTIHIGRYRRVVTLNIHGKDFAHDFLEKLAKDDHNKWKQMITRIAAVADYANYQNPLTFRLIGDHIFEFKRPGLRLYAFYDDSLEEQKLILCTNGGTKNNKKEQNRDIERAQSIRQIYFEAKTNPRTSITLIP